MIQQMRKQKSTLRQRGKTIIRKQKQALQKGKYRYSKYETVIKNTVEKFINETPIQKNLCTPMFIAAQFTIAKYWKQPKCPSVND